MAKATEGIQEAEFTEVEEQEGTVQTEVTIRMMEDGKIFFFVSGSDHNLITVEGLLRYADSRMKNVWKQRLEAEGQ